VREIHPYLGMVLSLGDTCRDINTDSVRLPTGGYHTPYSSYGKASPFLDSWLQSSYIKAQSYHCKELHDDSGGT
jgi:hypothetical protein